MNKTDENIIINLQKKIPSGNKQINSSNFGGVIPPTSGKEVENIYSRMDNIDEQIYKLDIIGNKLSQDMNKLELNAEYLDRKSKILDDKQKDTNTIMMGAIFVLGLAIIGWFWVGISEWAGEYRSLKEYVKLLEIEQNRMRSDIREIKKDNEIQIEKKYNEFLKIQLNKK